jgi:LPS-assembly lipoprotein
MRVRTALLSLTLLLTGCGFSPIYGPGPNGENAGPIPPVSVGLISGKAGHTLRTELTRLLAAGDPSGPAQRLEVNLNEQVIPLGIRLDESASRAELRLTADYILTPPSGEPLRGSLLSVVNYDIPLAAFAAITAQDDARERAAETMAQRLRAELAIRLRQAHQP